MLKISFFFFRTSCLGLHFIFHFADAILFVPMQCLITFEICNLLR
jgi:hypothetical protein